MTKRISIVLGLFFGLQVIGSAQAALLKGKVANTKEEPKETIGEQPTPPPSQPATASNATPNDSPQDTEEKIDTSQKVSLKISIEELMESGFETCIPEEYTIIETKLGRNLTVGDFNHDGIDDLAILAKMEEEEETHLLILERDTLGACPNFFTTQNITDNLIDNSTFSQIKTVKDDQVFFEFKSKRHDIHLYFQRVANEDDYQLIRSVYIIHAGPEYEDGKIIDKNFKTDALRIMAETGRADKVIKDRLYQKPSKISQLNFDEIIRLIQK